jgi:hypothetical protein
MIANFWYTGREVERSELSIIGIPRGFWGEAQQVQEKRI